MTDTHAPVTEALRAYAEALIKAHATEVEFLSIQEMADEHYTGPRDGEYDSLSDEQARTVASLIAGAHIRVEIPVSLDGVSEA